MKKCFAFTGTLLMVWALVVSVLLSAAPAAVYAADVSTAPKKIISVVMDDSGSMGAYVGTEPSLTRWEASTYALEAFAGLLNSRDEMYITYMGPVDALVKSSGGDSDDAVKKRADETTVQVDLSRRQSAVNQIQNYAPAGSDTPLLSVQAGIDKLTSIQEKDENTQFWLVIITDGAMQADYTKYSSYGEETCLQPLLDDNASLTMSNGTQINYCYLGIGSGSIAIDNHGDNDHFLAVNQTGDIQGSMQELANKISGRLQYKQNEITVSGDTLTVHSDLPLYSICAFTQESDAKVTGVQMSSSDSKSKKLSVDDNVSITSPIQGALAPGELTIYGNVARVTNEDEVIPAGDYTITFDKEVSLSSAAILYQPAIGMKAVIVKDGREVTDTSALAADDKVDIEVVPVNPSTEEEIAKEDIPEGTAWQLEYLQNGSSVSRADGRVLQGVTLAEGTNTIRATMQIPEMVPVTQTIDLDLTHPVVLDVNGNPTSPVYKRSAMGPDGAENPNTAVITGDGEVLSKEQLDDYKATLNAADTSVEVSYGDGFLGVLNRIFSHRHAQAGVSLADDGTFTIYPRSSDLAPFLITPGHYTVTLELSTDPSKTVTVAYDVTAELLDYAMLGPWVILFLFIIYVICILLFKPKFNGQKVEIDHFRRQGALGKGTKIPKDNHTVTLSKFDRRFLEPRPSRRSLPMVGLTVYADRSGGVYIKGKSLGRFDAYGSSGMKPEQNFNGVVSVLKPTKGKKAPALPDREFLGGGSYYVYNKSGKDLYRIRLSEK